MSILNRLVFQALAVIGCMGIASGASAQNWTNQSSMKVARVEATTVDYRDNIYVFNGFKPGIQIANSVEKYNVATKQWSIISPTSTMNDSAVTHNGVVRIGANVWIIGGRVGSHPGRVSKKIWIYNIDNGKWRRGPDLPVPSAAGGAALVNNKIHWIGGIDSNARCDVNHHFVYDLGKPKQGWKDITSSAGMPTPRNHFSTAVVNNIIYIMGGQFGHDGCPGKLTNDSPLVHAFNPANNQWSRKANMPNMNSHSEPGTFVYKGDIYTTGGENALDKVWKYSPSANKWSVFRNLPEKLVAPVARIIDGRLIVAGGGAPRAALATNTVRSLLVDTNPPPVQTQPDPQPEPVQPEPVQPEPVQPEPVQPEPVQSEPVQPEPGSHTPEGATLISMEAEYFDVIEGNSSHQWVHVAKGDSSNDAAMITTPDNGALADSVQYTPMLSYMVNINHTGKHYIWVRGSGDSNDAGVGVSDSIQVGLNGAISSSAYRIDTFPAQWTWSRHTPSDPVASLNVVNAGVNMVNLWMREDGLAIDKFVITNDPNFVPTGHGPDITDGTDNYVPPVTANEDNTLDDESIDVDQTGNDNMVDMPDESDGTNDDAVENDSSDQHSEEMQNTNNDQPEIAELISGESEMTNQVSNESNSTGGIFAGGASTTTLLALMALCFVRVRRYKQLA